MYGFWGCCCWLLLLPVPKQSPGTQWWFRVECYTPRCWNVMMSGEFAPAFSRGDQWHIELITWFPHGVVPRSERWTVRTWVTWCTCSTSEECVTSWFDMSVRIFSCFEIWDMVRVCFPEGLIKLCAGDPGFAWDWVSFARECAEHLSGHRHRWLDPVADTIRCHQTWLGTARTDPRLSWENHWAGRIFMDFPTSHVWPLEGNPSSFFFFFGGGGGGSFAHPRACGCNMLQPSQSGINPRKGRTSTFYIVTHHLYTIQMRSQVGCWFRCGR